MRKSISIKEEINRVLFPLDSIKLIILIIGVINLFLIVAAIVFLFYLVNWQYSFQFIVPSLIVVFSIIILVAYTIVVLCYLKLSRYFNKTNKFEKKFSRGFQTIVILSIISSIHGILSALFGILIWYYIANNIPKDQVSLYLDAISIMRIFILSLLSLILLKGWLDVFSSFKNYDKKSKIEDVSLIKTFIELYEKPKRVTIFIIVLIIIELIGLIIIILFVGIFILSGRDTIPASELILKTFRYPLIVIGDIIGLSIIAAYYKIKILSKGLKNKFGNRVALGFNIILVVALLNFIIDILFISLKYIIQTYIALFYNVKYLADFNYYFIPIYNLINLIISAVFILLVLYANLILVSSLKYYKKRKK